MYYKKSTEQYTFFLMIIFWTLDLFFLKTIVYRDYYLSEIHYTIFWSMLAIKKVTKQCAPLYIYYEFTSGDIC